MIIKNFNLRPPLDTQMKFDDSILVDIVFYLTGVLNIFHFCCFKEIYTYIY